MSIQNISFDESTESTDLSFIIEPIFIEHFKKTHGNSPTLAELKQHLVFTGIERLVEYVREVNSSLLELYSKSELTQETQLYIRHLH